MKKIKGTFLLVIILIVTVILMASFGLYFNDKAPIELPADIRGTTLFICPAASSLWDGIAQGFLGLRRYFVMGLFFGIIILSIFWGWRLYQSLVKNKVEKDDYKNVWGITKGFFWICLVIILLLHTPNYYRGVRVNNSTGYWVLCENTSPDARPISVSKLGIK